MDTYAKLKSDGSLEVLERVPNVINAKAATIKRYAKEHGYKLVLTTEAPGDWYNQSWKEDGAVIVNVWNEWDPQSKIYAIQTNVQGLLDSKAAERNYDNIFTALTYIESKNPKFKAEAEALRDWRDKMWTKCYEYLADVEAGKIKIPNNWDEVIPYLPSFTWPSV